jgi:radical SAM protein with 4Fe4S-binding SPASM domain
MIFTPKRKSKLFKFCKITHLPYLPFSLGIETGNICNLRCPLCPTGAGELTMKKGFMKFALFKQILDQLKYNLVSINLYSWGEPLLNPDLITMIKYAKGINKNIKIVTSTNLNIQNDSFLRDLIKSEIDEVIVSCDGVTQQTYEKYRIGGSFNLVMQNMELLISFKKEFSSKTDIVWNFLVFRHNEHEIEETKKVAENIGLILRIGKMRIYMKDEILKPHSESIRKYKDWIPDKTEYSAYDKEKYTTKKIIKTCRKPWVEISINWDGKVFPCCAVYGDEFSFGDAKENNIRHIWNNRMYAEARKQIINKKRKATTICGICRNNYFMHM